MNRLLVKIGTVFLAFILLAGLGFVVWAADAAEPMPEALAALTSTEKVKVTDEEWLVFQPTSEETLTGFIFYPGGKVNPVSYAPAAQQIAAQGFLVVIVPMPLNLAVLAPDRAEQVMLAFPEVQNWFIGGHSLGGAMAARFAFENPSKVKGLILWAAYPAQGNDLSDRNLRVLSISASLDGLATPEKIAESRALLPKDTVYISIQGGNHAQFGWYGDQSGDLSAAISRQEQQQQIIEATVRFMENYP